MKEYEAITFIGLPPRLIKVGYLLYFVRHDEN